VSLPVQKNSRINTVYRWLFNLTMGSWTGLISAAITASNTPFGQYFANHLGFNIVGTTLAGMILGNAAVDVFNAASALGTSTVNQDYQKAWILPLKHLTGTSGYLVVQPHHKKRWGIGEDQIDPRRAFKIRGVVATLEQAHTICQDITGREGAVKNVESLKRHYPRLMQNLAQNLERYLKDSLNRPQYTLAEPWERVRYGDAYLAYRTLQTPKGPRLEFAPPPPQTLTSPKAVLRYLRQQRLMTVKDRSLPRIPDGGYLEDSTVLAMAWQVQRHQTLASVPWTAVELKPHQWVAACRTLDDHQTPVWRFYPIPPRTLASAQAVQEALAPLLAPGTPAVPTDPFAPGVAQAARRIWHHHATVRAPVASTPQPAPGPTHQLR